MGIWKGRDTERESKGSEEGIKHFENPTPGREGFAAFASQFVDNFRRQLVQREQRTTVAEPLEKTDRGVVLGNVTIKLEGQEGDG